ncbi:unnamed protein product [Durusdinium trenchii]|uniref:Uncharacterized protein n=2 Tax=Durusdinium trenchii TaxID=1381693 RepID=A0ABP0S0E5_9DINO
MALSAEWVFPRKSVAYPLSSRPFFPTQGGGGKSLRRLTPAASLLIAASSRAALRGLRRPWSVKVQRKSRKNGREDLMQPRNAESKFWKWKWKEDGVPSIPLTVHYAKAESKIPSDVAVVLLHGFGVASFHYESQFLPLSDAGYSVYAIDHVGAGLSWPEVDIAPGGPEELRERPGSQWGFGPAAEKGFEELVIGESLWVKQIADFISEFVTESKVILAGNSLGGYLAVLATASMSPETVARIEGVALINATPFWGWIPNKSKNPSLYETFPWKGRLPIPENVRNFALNWYNTLRNPDSIEWLLNFVTSNPSGVGHELPERIAAMADHPAGAAAFAQIVFTPQADLTFDEALGKVVADQIPVLLLYGREDPWIVPYWGARAFKVAATGVADYLQLSPSGHCPHFETPEAVNECLLRWLQERHPIQGQASRDLLPKSIGESFTVNEHDAREILVTRRGLPEPFREGEIAWDELPAWIQSLF